MHSALKRQARQLFLQRGIMVLSILVICGCATRPKMTNTEVAFENAKATRSIKALDAFITEHPEDSPLRDEAILEKRKIQLQAEWLTVNKTAKLNDYLDFLKKSCVSTQSSQQIANIPEIQSALFAIINILDRDYRPMTNDVGLYISSLIDATVEDRYASSAPKSPQGCHYFSMAKTSDPNGQGEIISAKGFAYHVGDISPQLMKQISIPQNSQYPQSIDLTYISNGAFRFKKENYVVDSMIYLNGQIYTRSE